MGSRRLVTRGIAILLLQLLTRGVHAQWTAPAIQTPSDLADIEKALSGGIPMGRWKDRLSNLSERRNSSARCC
jgi:hypothetical protein